jgi:hypothetical protein
MIHRQDKPGAATGGRQPLSGWCGLCSRYTAALLPVDLLTVQPTARRPTSVAAASSRPSCYPCISRCAMCPYMSTCDRAPLHHHSSSSHFFQPLPFPMPRYGSTSPPSGSGWWTTLNGAAAPTVQRATRHTRCVYNRTPATADGVALRARRPLRGPARQGPAGMGPGASLRAAKGTDTSWCHLV